MLAVSARARGEKQHGFGAGRPQDWRVRRGCSPIEARGERGSVPASRSAFEREASGRDAHRSVSKNLLRFYSCAFGESGLFENVLV